MNSDAKTIPILGDFFYLVVNEFECKNHFIFGEDLFLAPDPRNSPPARLPISGYAPACLIGVIQISKTNGFLSFFYRWAREHWLVFFYKISTSLGQKRQRWNLYRFRVLSVTKQFFDSFSFKTVFTVLTDFYRFEQLYHRLPK